MVWTQRHGVRLKSLSLKERSLEQGDALKQFRSIASVAAVLSVLLGAGASVAVTAGEVVQTRRFLFDEMADALVYITNHWDDSGSYGNLAQAATIIERNAKSLPKLFPAGTSQSDGLRTAASDAIWTDQAGFNRLSNLLAEQAAKLTQTTPSTDSAQVKSEVKEVITTCKSCHRDYRN